MTRVVVIGAVLAAVAGMIPQSATASDGDAPEASSPSRARAGIQLEGTPSAAERLARQLAGSLERRVGRDSRKLTMMLTGNIGGNFARVDCRREEGYRDLHWARQVAHYRALRQLAEGTDRAEPVALNVGNSLFPGALGRYLTTVPDDGGARLADILDEIPLAAHGVGYWEFSAPREGFVGFLEAMRDRDVDVQAANVECGAFEGAESICGAMTTREDDRPYRIVERQGIDIAITTVLDRELLQNISQFQRQGIEILDPAGVLESLVDEMRADADLVVVQHQLPRDVASQRAFDLASDVEGIDLMVTNHLVDAPARPGQYDPEEPAAGGRMTVVEASGSGTPIISADSAERGAINVELDVVPTGDGGAEPGWALRRAVPRRVQLDEAPIHPPTRELLESTVDSFCRDWGRPIGERARIDPPFELKDLQQFVLQVMRFSARTEAALVNAGSFRNREQFPLTDRLTRADVYATMPFENSLVTVDVKGSVLKRLADRLGGDLIGVGIAAADGGVQINGRPLDEERTYRIATNEFLIQGGDGVLSPEDFANDRRYHPDWSDDPPPIGDIAIHYVEHRDGPGDGEVEEAIGAGDHFPDLHDRFLWTMTGSVNASYNQVSVDNPGTGYDQNPLTVQSTDQINLEGRLTVDADRRFHGWTNNLDLQYATARIADNDNNGFETTRDQIRLRSRYRYKRLRRSWDDRWYVPDPFVEGQAETEFQRPDGRDWHRLDLRAITGASFQLFDPLELQLGVNVSQDVLEPGGAATWGVNAAYTLARISPLQVMDRPIRFQSEVEYFYNDIGRRNIHEARSTNRIYFAIFEEVFFTTTFSGFLFRDDTVDQLGTNTELTVGVNYEWGRSIQSF